MASLWYPKFREALLLDQIGASLAEAGGLDIRAVLIDTGNYTYNAADDFLNDIPTAARLGGGTNPPTKSVSLTTKAILTGGIFDADNVTIPAVSGADPTAEAVVLFINTGTDSTSRLVLYIDNATGLPFTPNGGDANILWNASGIAQL
jgi:hypothetical protein